jgi:hypothetical protein
MAALALGAMLSAWGQQAGELRKCISASGATSFQQAPCAPGSRQVSSRAYVQERPPTAEQIRARAARDQAGRAESAELSRRAGTSPSRGRVTGGGTLHRVSIAHDDDACQRARRHRERTLEAVGLKRTYDLLRTLNDEVAQACR